MPIPESQLKLWSAQGSTAAARNTCAAIRYALLTEGRSLIRDMKVDLYMHGAYQNGTNLNDQDPVDIAVVLTSAWSQDLAMAGANQQDQRRLQGAWQDFRLDVLGTLRGKYGLVNVEDQPNCLRIEGAADRLPVNLAVGIQHRLYLNFGLSAGQQYQEGLSFWTPEDRQVVNFPKVHHENGQAKDGEAGTKGWFKPVVRMFKNARGYMVEREVIEASLAPSYGIECLVYNASNQFFGWSCQDSFAAVLKWLRTGQLAGLKVQSGIEPLFGDGPAQWSDKHARIFIDTLARVWNDWTEPAPAQ
jgi:hypothetical protein